MRKYMWICGVLAVGSPVVTGNAQTVIAAHMGMVSPAKATQVETVRNVLGTTLDIDLVNVPLRVAFDEIVRQSGVRISFSPLVVPMDRRVTVQGRGITLQTALQQALTGVAAYPRLTSGGQVVIVRGARDEVLQGAIVGRVVNGKTKLPVAGARISLDDSGVVATTDASGTFRVSGPVGNRIVHVRAVGFGKQAQTVTVKDGEQVTVEIVLESSASVLNEVIVTGTVVATERKAIANPITVITAEEIERRGITRIEQFFRGEVPGVLAMERGSEGYNPGTLGGLAKSHLYVRGSSELHDSGNFSQSESPLKVYLDGVELFDPSYLGVIDPASIERIEIITGPQAATVYGSGAVGGVMQIFTKKGSAGMRTPEMTLSLRYGVLESNLSDAWTPKHADVLTVNGGSGMEFSYAGTLSYNYTGQWQPGLFSRSAGGSAGVTYARGGVRANGSVATTLGANGTASERLLLRARKDEGEWQQGYKFPPSHIRSASANQTLSLTLDIRPASWWQNQVTVGKSQTNFTLEPQAPVLFTTADSLYRHQQSVGERFSASYNTTFLSPPAGFVRSQLTMGVTTSRGSQLAVDGCAASASATSLLACSDQWLYGASSVPVTVRKPLVNESWGGFGQWRVGVLEALYVTFGVRGERNPNYGKKHGIDWTPTTGVAYTMAHGDWTVKLMGSYGSATRPPKPEQKMEVVLRNPTYTPSSFVTTQANPDLGPEQSRGPQYGMEFFYGNRGSLTVNRYVQVVENLIQRVHVDSTLYIYNAMGSSRYNPTYQYQNIGVIRQHGWEMSGTLNIGMLSLKGSYSWNDSRITKLAPRFSGGNWQVGESFMSIPTHVGNVTLGYARGRSNVTFAINGVGKNNVPYWQSSNHELLFYASGQGRIRTYVGRLRYCDGYCLQTQPAYFKSDLAASRQLTSGVAVTANIVNLGNSFGKEGDQLAPATGRQTLLGLTLRYPRR